MKKTFRQGLRPLARSVVFLVLMFVCTVFPVPALFQEGSQRLFGTLRAEAAPFEMHVLDVGQGQGILIKADDSYMLVDGGGRNSSSFVVRYLKDLGIDTLACAAVSHYDEDHMSGVIGVLRAFKVESLLLPEGEGEGELFSSLARAAIASGCVVLHPSTGQSFTLGESVVEIVGPVRTDYPTDNDRSLSFRFGYGPFHFLICGDAETASETDMVQSGEDLSADVYVANHHGSDTSSSDLFLDAVSPAYAVISCGQDNTYGHPAAATMERLQNRNIAMFRTDKQGTIRFLCDGDTLWSDMDPCTDWSGGYAFYPLGEAGGTGEETEGPVSRQAGGTGEETEGPVSRQAGGPSEDTGMDATYENCSYVCNTNTMKFHYPTCPSVYKMKESNRMFTRLSREELIAEGYEPCGSCHP